MFSPSYSLVPAIISGPCLRSAISVQDAVAVRETEARTLAVAIVGVVRRGGFRADSGGGGVVLRLGDRGGPGGHRDEEEDD